MSKASKKTPAEHEKWVKDLTAMRRRNRDQLAAMKEYKAKEAMAKRAEEAKKADAANKHGGRRTRRK
jgi:hypothetical protein